MYSIVSEVMCLIYAMTQAQVGLFQVTEIYL